ncbi:MAG: hypothetical protein QXE31_02790 [Candidatus Woesearchaeota archaeon]
MNLTDLKERIFGNKFNLDNTFLKSFYENYFFNNEIKNSFFHNINEKNRDNSLLEEILEELVKEKTIVFKNNNFLEENLEEKTLQEKISKLNNTVFIIEEEKLDDKRIFLYEFFPNTYYVYLKRKITEDDKKEQNKNNKKLNEDIYGSFGYFSLFVPTGVIVNRVPQSVLGNGVLGRAFIYSNYIEILDSLVGNEYIEVLTHEVLHILYPEKKEMEIRMITRNYLGNTVYN